MTFKISLTSSLTVSFVFSIPDPSSLEFTNMTKRKKNSISSKMSVYVWLIFLLKQLSIGELIICFRSKSSQRKVMFKKFYLKTVLLSVNSCVMWLSRWMKVKIMYGNMCYRRSHSLARLAIMKYFGCSRGRRNSRW